MGDGREIAEVARGEEAGALGWVAAVEQLQRLRERRLGVGAVTQCELGGALQQPDVGHVGVDLDRGVGSRDRLFVVASVEGDEREEALAEKVAVAAEIEGAGRVGDRGRRSAAAAGR